MHCILIWCRVCLCVVGVGWGGGLGVVWSLSEHLAEGSSGPPSLSQHWAVLGCNAKNTQGVVERCSVSDVCVKPEANYSEQVLHLQINTEDYKLEDGNEKKTEVEAVLAVNSGQGKSTTIQWKCPQIETCLDYCNLGQILSLWLPVIIVVIIALYVVHLCDIFIRWDRGGLSYYMCTLLQAPETAQWPLTQI